MTFPFLRAITLHMRYLRMVESCMKDPSIAYLYSDHHDCAFGQWYYSDETLDQLQTIQLEDAQLLWQAIEKHHIDFHFATNAAMLAREEGAFDQMESDHVTLEQISTSLTNALIALNQLIKQANQAAS
jgi:hypothetical protein